MGWSPSEIQLPVGVPEGMRPEVMLESEGLHVHVAGYCLLTDALYAATLQAFQNIPCYLPCSYHLFPYGSFMIGGSGSELFCSP